MLDHPESGALSTRPIFSHRERIRLLVVVVLALASLPARADVAFDGSIGGGPAGAAPTRAPAGFSRDYLVTYDESSAPDQRFGEIRGPNLFQSLDRLDLAFDERVTFQALDATGAPITGLERVITRMTSGSPSLIEGVLRSEVPGADLYLLNPAGITFRGAGGLRQRLELPAGLVLGTSDFLRFEGGGPVFETGSPTPASLSAAPVESFGFLAGAAGDVVFDQADIVAVSRGAGLTVVAGDVVVTGEKSAALESNLEAPGGLVQLAAVGGAATEVPVDVASWSVRDDPGSVDGDIVIEAFAEVLASDPGGTAQGRIVVRGGNLVVDDALVQAGGNQGAIGAGADDPEPSPESLAIDIEVAEQIEVRDFAVVQARGSSAAGQGGMRLAAPRIRIGEGREGTFVGSRTSLGAADAIRVEATSLVLLENGELGTQVFGNAEGGDLVVSAGELEVRSGGVLSTGTFAGNAPGGLLAIEAGRMTVEGTGAVVSENEVSGNPALAGGQGGDLEISATTLELSSGGQVRASTLSDRDAGSISVRVSERLTLDGDDPARETAIVSRTGSASSPSGSGSAGDIDVTAPIIELSGRSVLSARSVGRGNAGNLDLVASDRLSLDGSDAGAPDISARGIDGDRAGAVAVTAGRLELRGGGAISTATIGRAPAGRIDVTAQQVDLEGTDDFGNRSSISSESASTSSDAGDAGVIAIDIATDLEVSEGAQIVVRSRGAGDAGSIGVTAGGTIRVRDGGSINATADATGEAGNVRLDASQVEIDGGLVTTEAADGSADGIVEPIGGDITLAATDQIRITRGAVVSASSVGSQDAGRIALDTGNRILVSDSTITTEATESTANATGGQVDLRAEGEIALLRSRISTSVRASESDQDGGDVTIDSRLLVVNQSELLARAAFGTGGNIRVIADTFLPSADSLFDVSSAFGVDGTVLIEGPEDELKEGILRLSADFLDATQLLGARCASRDREQGSFVVGDRAGLLPAPTRPLSVPMPLPDGLEPDAVNVSAVPAGLTMLSLESCALAPPRVPRVSAEGRLGGQDPFERGRTEADR